MRLMRLMRLIQTGEIETRGLPRSLPNWQGNGNIPPLTPPLPPPPPPFPGIQDNR